MKLLRIAFIAALAAYPHLAWAQIPAFPGADGAGRDVTGGRGGVVYHVTVLDRGFGYSGFNGPGTLRYGLNDSNFVPGTKRTIVFDIAGTFWLGRYGADRGHFDGWDPGGYMSIGSNVTLAGQTAPGPVIISGATVKLGNNSSGESNSIVRNITIAPGYGQRSFEKPDENPPELPTPGDFPDSYTFDALDISANHAIVDHVSTFYATDETISTNELANNLTVQYSNVSQGQNYPQADAESPGTFTGHALGSLLQAGSGAKISIINNLYAQQKGRLPRVGSEVGTGAFNDFRNNVFYNWFNTAGTGADRQPSFNNFIDNFYLAGPGGENANGTSIVYQGGGTSLFEGDNGANFTRVYQSGNLKDVNKDGDPDDTLPTTASSSPSTSFDFRSVAVQATAYDVNIGVTLEAADAFRNVLRYMGDRWWERDYDMALGNTAVINTVDERLVHETYTGTGKIMAWADNPFNDYDPPLAGYQAYDPNEGAEWRSLLALRVNPATGAAPFNRSAGWDDDGDGMPGFWEVAHGFDPEAANNNDDDDGDGYTDLEEYLNELAAWPAPGPIVFQGGSSQYASILNWKVSGEVVNIAGSDVTTSSLWQPSRYDTAVLHNGAMLADKVGQHAGILKVAPDAGDDAELQVADGWLRVADTLEVAAAGDGGVVTLLQTGQLHVHRITKGANGEFRFLGGRLNADIVEFSLTNDGGTIAPGKNVFDLPGGEIDFGGVDAMHVLGDLDIQSGAIEFDVAGNQTGDCDLVQVDGKLTGGGLLKVSLDGYNPVVGDAFKLFDFSSAAGAFKYALPALDESLAWDTSKVLTTGVLRVVAIPEPASVVMLWCCAAVLFVRRR